MVATGEDSMVATGQDTMVATGEDTLVVTVEGTMEVMDTDMGITEIGTRNCGAFVAIGSLPRKT